jgi:hypothetical protein
MPQHVRMDAERHPGGLSKPGQHPAKGNGSHRGTALAHEDISPRLLLSLEAAQGAKLGCHARRDELRDKGRPRVRFPGAHCSGRSRLPTRASHHTERRAGSFPQQTQVVAMSMA